MKLTKSPADFKKLASTVREQMSAKLPSFYEMVSLEASGVSIKGIKADANRRIDLTLEGTQIRAGYFKGVDQTLDTYDVWLCKNVQPFTVEIGGSPVTYAAGEAVAFKLVEPGRKAVATKKAKATADPVAA